MLDISVLQNSYATLKIYSLYVNVWACMLCVLKVKGSISVQHSLPIPLWQGFFWAENPSNPSVCPRSNTQQPWRYIPAWDSLGSLCGCWDLNLGSHGCIANAFKHGAIFQPPLNIFFFKWKEVWQYWHTPLSFYSNNKVSSFIKK